MRSRLRSGDAAGSFKSFGKIGCRDLWLMASAVGRAGSVDVFVAAEFVGRRYLVRKLVAPRPCCVRTSAFAAWIRTRPLRAPDGQSG